MSRRVYVQLSVSGCVCAVYGAKIQHFKKTCLLVSPAILINISLVHGNEPFDFSLEL